VWKTYIYMHTRKIVNWCKNLPLYSKCPKMQTSSILSQMIMMGWTTFQLFPLENSPPIPIVDFVASHLSTSPLPRPAFHSHCWLVTSKCCLSYNLHYQSLILDISIVKYFDVCFFLLYFHFLFKLLKFSNPLYHYINVRNRYVDRYEILTYINIVFLLR